jgi:hypothetical protein
MAKARVSRGGMRLPVNRSFERELALLEAMSGQLPDAQGIENVRKALGNQNNYLVAKAARIVADFALVSLLPEVLSAFERFFIDPVISDPQCWAKNALVKALVRLDCHDAAVYLRGLRHTQEEPVWGGQSDTAGALRGTCTHALVACDELTTPQLLDLLLEPMVDPDKTVRVEAARAIGHVGGVSAALLLKLRILLGKDEPEVLGACFSALLGMDHGDKPAMIALVAGFLNEGEDTATEAAFALADTHEPAALKALIEARRKGADPWFTAALDQAIALTRLPEGVDFLLALVEENPRQAASALEALSGIYRAPEMRVRVAASVVRSESDRAESAFQKFFPEPATEA